METFVYLHLDGAFIPIGKLYFEDMGVESRSVFAYGKKYLQKKSVISIDPIGLPLKDQEFSTEIDTPIFNVFRDSAPDNWGRYILTKRFNRELTELEYVLAVGGNRVGALAYGPDLSGPKILGPDGYEAYEIKDFDLEYSLNSIDLIVTNSKSESLKEFLRYGSSLGGARPKAHVKIDGEHYIAKFSVSFDQRNEPLIEYACMRLAQMCGLDMPEIKMVKILGRDVFLIKRFDRIVEKKLMNLHFISALTATGLHERDYASWSYPHIVQAITNLSFQSAQDKTELYSRMIFNILVNNDDDHMRNHGFLHIGKNRWKLSPLYDVVPRSQRSNTFRLALNIGSYAKEASKRNALSASNYFGINLKDAEEIWNNLEEIVSSQWQKVFLDSGLSKKEVMMFDGCIGGK
jgi:serine/threonine-protein kinase HipA